jgi:hypothetical protein
MHCYQNGWMHPTKVLVVWVGIEVERVNRRERSCERHHSEVGLDLLWSSAVLEESNRGDLNNCLNT